MVKNLAAACFMLMLQVYLIAPLLPAIGNEFHSTLISQAIPAFAIPYGLSALCSISLSNRVGRKVMLQWSVWLMTLGCFATASCHSISAFLVVRILAGIATGSILPLALVLIAECYPASARGTRMLIVVFSVALGITFAPVIGGYFNGMIGWRTMYIISGILSLIVYLRIVLSSFPLPLKIARKPENLSLVWQLSKKILTRGAGPYLYAFSFFGGMFHTGVFVWLSFYFTTHYHLGEQGIALVLLIFLFPGLLMVILMAAFSIKTSVKGTLLAGLILVAVCVALLWINVNLPLWLAYLFVLILSVGFNITQPLFIGITTTLHNGRMSNQAVGMGCGILFLGYGAGPMLFVFLVSLGDSPAIIFLALLGLLLSILSFKVWKEKLSTDKHITKRNFFTDNQGMAQRHT